MSSNKSNSAQAFSDLKILGKLNQAKFGVFLASSPSTNSHFALKLFPFTNGETSLQFLNEIRFSNLSHPNIISPIHYVREKVTSIERRPTKVSYTLMEYAPHGDFFDVLMTKNIEFDEKLVRTYFHQLVGGLEYIHTNSIGHMDIKADNLVLDQCFQLKITDFDSAVIQGQNKPTSGTLYYRAPEIIGGVCKDAQAADIYSAGAMLFLMKCGTYLPHLEHEDFEGCDLLDLLNNNIEGFWQKHCEIQERSQLFFDEDFKSLFIAMTRQNPEERATLAEITNSNWFKKPVYTKEEVKEIMTKKLSL